MGRIIGFENSTCISPELLILFIKGIKGMFRCLFFWEVFYYFSDSKEESNATGKLISKLKERVILLEYRSVKVMVIVEF